MCLGFRWFHRNQRCSYISHRKHGDFPRRIEGLCGTCRKVNCAVEKDAAAGAAVFMCTVRDVDGIAVPGTTVEQLVDRMVDGRMVDLLVSSHPLTLYISRSTAYAPRVGHVIGEVEAVEEHTVDML